MSKALLIARPELFKNRVPEIESHLSEERTKRLGDHPRWWDVDGKKVPVLWPSTAGDCARKSCYDILEPEKAMPEEVKGAMRLFDGDFHEETTKHWLSVMRYEVTATGQRVRRLFKRKGKPYFKIHGKLDGRIWVPDENGKGGHEAVLECKGLSTFTVKKKDPAEVIFPNYQAQAQVYMRLTKLRSCVFTIKDKNTSEIHFYEQKWSDGLNKRVMRKILRVVKAVRKGKLLPRDYDDPKALPCQWCRHSDRCWGISVEMPEDLERDLKKENADV